jgi:hypothetical protein
MQEKFKVNTLFQDRIVIKPRDKKGKPKDPHTLERLHESWFFKLKPKYYVELQKEWNENNLKIVLPALTDYDDWLNHFKTLPPSHIKLLAATGQDFLSTEAYAALSRWHDIIANPHRIEKIHQSGLTKPKGKDHSSIIAMALANDRLGVLKATRDQIAEKLDKGAGARDTAALAREMTEIMTQISDYEKRAGPKKDTKLGQLLGDMGGGKTKRASRNGSGARNTNFHSRVTIEDIEG